MKTPITDEISAETPAAPQKVDGRRLRGDRRKQKILASARKVFIENGYRRTTLDAIIASAGGSRQTIYQRFGGKSGLFSAIIKLAEVDFITSVAAIESHNGLPREVLTEFGLRLIETWRSPEGVAVNRMILSEGLESAELMAAWFASGPQPSLAHLADYLANEHAGGRLDVADPHVVARQFMFLLIGALAWPTMAGEGDETVRRDIDAAVELVLAGCRKDAR